ncbi:F-box only protein 4 [Osmerus mordax]|uniref:F-box only protein 4 n=1 Tax=Osmerus mordax TaxID=8014 RepID=UPI00350FCF96
MAGSETAMVKKTQCNESVLISNLRRFRDKYITDARRRLDQTATTEMTDGKTPLGSLGSLPVDLQFLIMTLLSPPDLCRLGATSSYWQVMVRDPLLWRYFLLRDMPHWPSIDHVTMPQLKDLKASLFDREEDTDEMQLDPQQDLMAEYLRGCPACRQRLQPPQQLYKVVTSLLLSYVMSAEPRYAMFGPGMEQLDVSIVCRLMHSPVMLPVVETTQRQINGIGSGISYMYKNQHKFNILTLYSTNRAERERARVEHLSVPSKLFILEGTDQSGRPIYTPTPQVQEVCHIVNGFIYVANAEQGEGELQRARMQAVLGHARDWSDRPLLVLSCVSREDPDLSSLGTRTSCVDMAQRLGLPLLPNPWMVQDTVAESLSGFLDGISWLLHYSGVRL